MKAAKVTVLPSLPSTSPPHWNGQRTVGIIDDEDNDAQMTVEPCLAKSVRRAAVLAQHGLCRRITLGLDASELRFVEVYWEG